VEIFLDQPSDFRVAEVAVAPSVVVACRWLSECFGNGRCDVYATAIV